MTNINLKPFCSTEHSRNQLHRPYNVGDYTYATNAKMAIRIKMNAEYSRDDSNSPEPPKQIENLFSTAIGSDDRWIDLPLDIFHHEDEKQECKSCRGTGGHDCDCEFCQSDCEDCGGHGYKLRPPKYKFTNGIIISGEYLDELKPLPGPVQVRFNEDGSANAFRGPGWHVLIMPMPYAYQNVFDIDVPKCAEVENV